MSSEFVTDIEQNGGDDPTDVEVPVPFYKAGWFIGLIICLVIVALFLLYRLQQPNIQGLWANSDSSMTYDITHNWITGGLSMIDGSVGETVAKVPLKLKDRVLSVDMLLISIPIGSFNETFTELTVDMGGMMGSDVGGLVPKLVLKKVVLPKSTK
jgi:hypothetical protein